MFGGLVLDIVANVYLGLEADFEGSARWAIGFGVLRYIVGALLLISVKEPERRQASSGFGALGGG